jgi:DNA polymerase-3 subunit gamma/tau
VNGRTPAEPAPASGAPRAAGASRPPAPAAAPPPALDGVVDLDPWRSVIDSVRARRAPLASVLEHAAVLDFRAQQVVIAYEENSFLTAQATDPAALDLLRSALREHFGSVPELRFETVALGTAPRTVARLATAERKARTDAARRAVAEHPLVSAAIELLGAELRDVRLAQDLADNA